MATDQIPIPSWEIQSLDQLAAQGQLSGIDPNVLAVMSQEESGGEVAGAGINSSGYGGYFGLGAGKQYPGGTISSAEMEQNSPQSFIDQAKVAASAFASYWTGNVLTTEDVYQSGHPEGGSSPGAQLMSKELSAGELAGGSNPVPATGTTGGGGSASATTGGTANATTTGLLGDLLNWTGLKPILIEAILVSAGLGIIVLAAYKAASPALKRTAGDAAQLAPLAAA